MLGPQQLYLADIFVFVLTLRLYHASNSDEKCKWKLPQNCGPVGDWRHFKLASYAPWSGLAMFHSTSAYRATLRIFTQCYIYDVVNSFFRQNIAHQRIVSSCDAKKLTELNWRWVKRRDSKNQCNCRKTGISKSLWHLLKRKIITRFSPKT